MKRRRDPGVARQAIAEALRVLSVPFPLPSVSEAERRAAARGLRLTRYLPEPQPALPLPKTA